MSLSRPSFHRILIFASAVLGMALTFSLGMWQVGRGDEKLALQAAKDERSGMAVLDWRGLTGSMTSAEMNVLMYRQMVLKGRWLPAHTVYLENRQMNGRAGFYVMTPMRLDSTDTVVLVQRGWAPRSFKDRQALPLIETSDETVEVTGTLAPWPSRLYDFGGVEVAAIRQNLDLISFRQQTGLDLKNFSLVQTGAASEGLLRDWPVVASGVEKHQGYAFQWFGLCALIALLYVWFQIVQASRKK
ncbi:transmembrane cytochrome oxidase [Limnohabitans sp. Jir72]|nr:SURF1 family protein [Limnohabitans sp. Jir72]PUE33837.1 transmembrane cytochrome oxidase [Limnohabitans sp. Jir72]